MKKRNPFPPPTLAIQQDLSSLQLILSALNSLDDSIEIVDVSGKLIFSSDKFQALDGISRENVFGQPFMDFYNLTESSSLYIKNFKTGKVMRNDQTIYTPKGGRPKKVVAEVYPIYANGVMVGSISITRDDKRAQQLVDELAVAKRFNKIHTKSKFDNGTKFRLDDIYGESKVIKNTIDSARHVAQTNVNVLIYGETGTGKELFAQGIHNASTRAKHKFVPLNCGALPETLMEGLLFGTTKGVYTGAENRPGYFEEANHGTLFLDEINSMPLSLQAKLLRVLEDGWVRRLGSNQDIATDVRIISAMNISPQEAIGEQVIRPDFFYRLSSFSLECHPLRKRSDDILIYCLMYIEIYKKMMGRKVESISRAAIELLVKYSWPGNVRELKHVMESAVINMAADEPVMDTNHFPAWLISGGDEHHDGSPLSAPGEVMPLTKPQPNGPYDLAEKMKEMEITMLKDALKKNDYNLTNTAKFLNISKQTLFYKLKRFKIKLSVSINDD